MKNFATFVVWALLLVVAGAEPFDFTPRASSYLCEDIVFHNIKFKQGSMDVTYDPPRNWECSGGGEHGYIRPQDRGSSIRGEMLHFDNTPPIKLDEDGYKALKTMAATYVPGKPEDVQLLSEDRSAVNIYTHPAVEYTFSCKIFGLPSKVCVVISPIQREQFVFVLRGDAKEFDDAQLSFVKSLYSLTWRKPTN